VTPALVYFSCETYTGVEIARALLDQGRLSEEELAAVEEHPDSRELVEFCGVNNWNLTE
jgi:hypothetical protein